MSNTESSFRLLTFRAYDKCNKDDNESDSDESSQNAEAFLVQMFGINAKGETASIIATDYKPFFYAKVPDYWENSNVNIFITQLRTEMGNGFENAIVAYKLVKRKKLYGFDGGKNHTFVWISFTCEKSMKRAKNCWYYRVNKNSSSILKKEGYFVNEDALYLYEAQIPPLLRMFHMREMSPSGWISVPNYAEVHGSEKKTSCKYEYIVSYKNIKAMPTKEEAVPYKICSFDIEASSSHGDFPLAKKDYKKLATNIVDIWLEYGEEDIKKSKEMLKWIVLTAFEFDVECQYTWLQDVEFVYPKFKLSKPKLTRIISTWLNSMISSNEAEVSENKPNWEGNVDEDMDAGQTDSAVGAAEESTEQNDFWFSKKKSNAEYNGGGTVLDVIHDKSLTRELKISAITKSFNVKDCKNKRLFPRLKGDEVTFIGSTFLKNGAETPYLNHCIVKNTCDPIPGAELETYTTEREVLIAWAKLIQREDPDIIIGYNIFGFDYSFMYVRSEELGCKKQFLKLSRNLDEVCLSYNWKTKTTGLEESTIFIASGQHDLKFAKIPGRLQIDLYNYLRRDYQLTQYKLDYVAGHFIGDSVKKVEFKDDTTKIVSSNLVGLELHSYICFEELAHSSEMYKDGEKFKVVKLNKKEGIFWIEGNEMPDMTKKVKWGLAKDDVTPQDIFRMTHEGPTSRAVIAKYCIQDCNLVQQLLRKIDVLTGFIEMSALCSVPLDYLVMRGQGIKLTSYIAKKCREKNTLMPVIGKASSDEAYEGAIVLDPKCGLYLNEPVACVDYSSLYPSSMISENISHDTKVWTKEYDLNDRLIGETGEKNEKGEFMYDNLNNYKYVDITYDTYKWRKKATSAAVEKVKVGYKTCRFAQFTNGQHGIMPSVLKELLAARKATRKQIPNEKDPFMRNVLDKRQLSIKLTANSLYGGNGAKTSSFYEQDCAASTTATGRKLLTYAKRVIEEAYSERIVEAQGEKVRIRAEYVYGDTDSVFFKFNLRDLNNVAITGKKALVMTIELAKQAGEMASKFLKPPHDLEYEKTFLPWCLLSKKRYVGMLYEEDPNKCKRKSMGIVLKRRDNAPIVKDVYGGVIDVLMQDQNVNKAVAFMQDCLRKMIKGEYGMDKLVITKSLRSGYKNPKQIAHKVLADRMGRRDPGNKPRPGDRIAFAYFQNPNRKALQGDKIETPEYIKENNLKLNYEFYITNQLMKPLQQLFALVLEDLPGFKKKKGYTLRTWKRQLADLSKQYSDPVQLRKKEEMLRNKEVKELLFQEHLRGAEQLRTGNQNISSFFMVC